MILGECQESLNSGLRKFSLQKWGQKIMLTRNRGQRAFMDVSRFEHPCYTLQMLNQSLDTTQRLCIIGVL